jgi:hypothetical protein
MCHDHFFFDDPAGTLMKDRFEFQSPLGPLGSLVDLLFLKTYMKRFLIERDAVLKQVAESDAWRRYLK